MSTATTASPSKVILKNVRFSYAHVFEPKAIGNSSEAKYSVSLIIQKSDTEGIAALNAAIKFVEDEVKAKNKGKLPANFKKPLRDGDAERPDDEAYADAYFINASSKTKPGIVNRVKEPIIDQDKFYSGCFGNASINLYYFDVNGNRGIACGLNNLMKTKDGDALSGRASAEQDFADIEAEEDLLA